MKSHLSPGLILFFAVCMFFLIDNAHQPAYAQQGPSAQGSDALWHLPQFGESGWFLHAHNGRVRACNMDKSSVVGEKQAPRCSSWQ